MMNSIKNILHKKPHAVIAIDGNCAAGKTTLAKTLAKLTDAQIIHTDDFFLPPEMRTPERLSQPGGNIHYERFLNEVCNGIKSEKKFEYRVFSCKTGDYSGTAIIDPTKPIIVEGSYSMHPEFCDIYDYGIFLTVDPQIQLERILNRNGKEDLEVFKSKWIPLENKYFDYYGIKDKCDIIL